MDAFSQTLSRLAVTMLGENSIQSVLDSVVGEAKNLLPVDGAGVVLPATVTAPEYLVASDPTALGFEQLQSSLDQGPCVLAQDTMTVVSMPSLGLEEAFPQFTAAAHDLGLAGAIAFPLGQDGVALGALDLYLTSPGALGAAEMRAAQALADMLTAYLVRMGVRAVLEATSRRDHQAVERLQELSVERDDFVATLTHELGTPIANIAGYTELLEDGPDGLTRRQREFLSAIHRNSDRLRELSADLLTLFSLDPGAPPPVHAAVDLRAVVAAARSLQGQAAAALAHDVFFRVPESPVVVQGDAAQLERMLSNLVSNAVKYTPPDGTIVCSLRRQEGEAVLEVRDTGVGIPEGEQRQLFTRFFRASTAKKLGVRGTGLGLAIVKAVVDGHGGTIDVSSKPGRGTRFRVRLPLAEEHRPDAAIA